MTRSIRWPLTIIVTLVALIGVAGFASLGIWQVKRLAWKTDLIARVDARVDAPVVAAPGLQDWPGITRDNSEYRHVTLSGEFLNDQEVQIYVPSEYGPSYWIMTPLKRDDGTIVMVNRGVVPEEFKDPATRTAPSGLQTVNGLLRLSEDQAWLFSQDNRPEEQTWYRRDITSITQTLGFTQAAPYFVDQELVDPQSWPRGGKTVVSFRNSHLSYALTWFALALLVVLGWALFLRHERNRAE
ncbi:Surfeit locus 1 family protein [Thioclava sp. SK-1]|uniref:SURF1 family protein n=1 Tax=Thioclava sp. SK-1 TaxID=1889770 RepID=UPI000825E1A5|nr:SURF1 family protein [Thioclava sp. SK-1]OCX65970.1 Surfeit locus 1 family protein [Thioclava sp. SK-1]